MKYFVESDSPPVLYWNMRNYKLFNKGNLHFMASIEIKTNEWPGKDVLSLLLMDRSTKKNIIFATDSYEDLGSDYGAKNQITEQLLTVDGRCLIQPRVLKSTDEQLLRTRKKAEVFTPSWVCCLMNNHIDEAWFDRPDVFGRLEEQKWTPAGDPIEMPKRKRWQAYVDSRRLEITCGEAPYLVSRYDMATGEIIPLKDRIGILDRKLRIVNENTATEDEWLEWALRAYQSVYGYEYQGDNLLVARINLLLTYIDYLQDRWNRKPKDDELAEIAKVISWNIWQMDGLKGTIPMGALYEQYHQFNIFDLFSMDAEATEEESEEYIPCRIYDWRGQNKSIEFNAFKEGRNGSMKFDFIIGNPPYQDETVGENTSYAPQIYNKFMDETYTVGNSIELIHPARFLFDAGSTPKAWNRKMLDDPHFKVIRYYSDSKTVFPNMEITGGVAVSYYSISNHFGSIGVFTPYEHLNTILHKVIDCVGFEGMDKVVISRTVYRLSEKLHEDYPTAITQLSKGHAYDMASNIFERLPQVFSDIKPSDGKDYIQMLGREGGERVYKYIRKDYVKEASNLYKYKIVFARADGAAGTIGKPIPARVLGSPVIESPGVGTTESFLSVGSFENAKDAENAFKYVKTRFSRTLVSVLKTTQDITPDKFKYVPLQDFTSASDIDWSQSVAGIDRQLYKKYELSEDEISFIETHVKEME